MHRLVHGGAGGWHSKLGSNCVAFAYPDLKSCGQFQGLAAAGVPQNGLAAVDAGYLGDIGGRLLLRRRQFATLTAGRRARHLLHLKLLRLALLQLLHLKLLLLLTRGNRL